MKLLVPVSQPSSHTSKGEKDGEEVCGEPHGLVDDARVKVHVGVEVTLDEVF